MKINLSSPLAVWIVLVLATVASYLSQVEAVGSYPRLVGSGILVIAFFKVWMIGMWYMELHRAVTFLRLAYLAWTVILAGILIALFWAA